MVAPPPMIIDPPRIVPLVYPPMGAAPIGADEAPTDTVPWLATTAKGPSRELLPTTAEDLECWTDCWVQVVLTVSVQSLMISMSTTVLQTVLATFLGLFTGTWLHCLTGTLRQIGADVETGLTPVLAATIPAENPASASRLAYPEYVLARPL